MQCKAGREWPGKLGDHPQHRRSTPPSAPVCAGSLANCQNVESWGLSDAVIGAWCFHRRGIQKIPLADATVKIFDFPEEHEHFILKSP